MPLSPGGAGVFRRARNLGPAQGFNVLYDPPRPWRVAGNSLAAHAATPSHPGPAMFRTLRLLFFAFTFIALVALGGRALALWSGHSDAWVLARQLLAEVRRSQALGAREEASRRYNRAKQAVTDELIAGRLSLAEAAERFAQLSELMEGPNPGIGSYKEPAGEQAVWRNVITWVSARVARGSSQQEAVLARLEAEYRARFGAAGPVPVSAGLDAPA